MTGVIFANATGIGGAIAVFRVSGTGAGEIVAALAGNLPQPRRASLRRLHDASGATIDQALLLWFPAPNSVTGEDYAELHTHGGRAVAASVNAALIGQGARPAEPGEFARRSFGNGKLDLIQAEGIADLIAAETEGQRRLALDQADGVMGETIASWRERLIGLMARQAALIDFADEDLPPEVEAAMVLDIASLRGDVAAAIKGGAAAERLREGIDIVVLGAPNAGKSTLVNAIAGEEVAIVSEIAGTTRDLIGVRLDLGGVPVRLVDTAGLRDARDAIEAEGVRRAVAQAERADLVLLCVAAPEFAVPFVPGFARTVAIATKADLTDVVPSGMMAVSAQTGAGLPALIAALYDEVATLVARGAGPALPRPRQMACLRDMVGALDRALLVSEAELRAADLQAAADALARLVGVIGVEDILDQVFSSFCIGK